MKAFYRSMRRPGTNSSRNKYVRDVVGNKTDDAANDVPSDTESQMAYLKQCVNLLLDIQETLANQ